MCRSLYAPQFCAADIRAVWYTIADRFVWITRAGLHHIRIQNGIIWSGLLGKIFLDETVVISSIIGGGVIMIASIIDFVFEFNRGKRTKCE